MPQQVQSLRWSRVTMIIILLLGMAVLLHNLTASSLWSDEGWTIATSAENNLVDTITEWVAVDVHPPLFFLELNIWRRFTGDTILEMRYFSVLLTLLAIAVIYRASKAIFGERAGLLAALFYALHDLVNVLTQEVRHYPQQMLLVSLAVWLYWRFWRRPTRTRGVVFALAGAALLYTHYWGGFVLAGCAVHALLTRRHMLRPYILGFIGVGLLFAPWVPVLIHQITLERPGGLPHALENSQLVYAVLLFQVVGIPEVFWLVLAGIGVFGVFTGAVRRWWPSSASLLPFLIVLLTVTLTLSINAFYPTLSIRGMAVLVPVVILLAAHGLSGFRGREQIAMIIFIVVFSLTSKSAQSIEAPPWPEIVDLIVPQSDATDIVLLENVSDGYATAYYLDQMEPQIPYAYTYIEYLNRPETYLTYLDEALVGKNGAWIAQLEWPAIRDIRPALQERGWVQTMPELDYGVYDTRPTLIWRFDRLPQEGESPVAAFDEVMRLWRAEYSRQPEHVTVNMLWSPQETPVQNYTVSVFLMGPNGEFVNTDSYPLRGQSPTLTWEPGQYYFDSSEIATAGLEPGSYRVGVQVYYFTDNTYSTIQNTTAEPCGDDPECRLVFLGTVELE